jgi:predicted nucleic acid-binding protein
MMAYFTYDTSVIISRRALDRPDLPDSFLLSSVVLMELMSSCKDESQRKIYERLFREYQSDNSLIIPNEDDWLLASKILFMLTQNRRRASNGGLRRLSIGVSQRMALDALIAVSARRWKAIVVTENWDDFKAIQRYCRTTRVVRASEFFSR